jgi:hypothetical protein
MSLKFRLKGLAETFIDKISCPECGHDGGEDGDKGFYTELTRVTYDGIIVVVRCGICGNIFVPDGQKLGVINPQKLRTAVEKDSETTGLPIFPSIASVRLDVERLNAARNHCLH